MHINLFFLHDRILAIIFKICESNEEMNTEDLILLRFVNVGLCVEAFQWNVIILRGYVIADPILIWTAERDVRWKHWIN